MTPQPLLENEHALNANNDDNVHRNLALAEIGYLIAPAGCGKTEAIMRSVKGGETQKKQLILTHTNAGVHALERRFLKDGVPRLKYQIETISSWALGWVRAYPRSAEYNLPINSLPKDDNEWKQVQLSAKKLLQTEFIKWILANSYSGIIIDEYQDCTKEIHETLIQLKDVLPLRVLGDPLQGIFNINNNVLIDWETVKTEYRNELGTLNTPHRWINAGNRGLGEWLLTIRNDIGQITRNNFSYPHIELYTPTNDQISNTLTSIINRKNDGQICIIGPNERVDFILPKNITTTLLKRKFALLEPENLPVLKSFIHGTNVAQQAYKFFEKAFCGDGFDLTEKKFLKGCLGLISHRILGNGEAALEKKRIRAKYQQNYSPSLVYELLIRLEGINNIQCRFQESAYTLKKILMRQIQTSESLELCYETVMSARRHRKRHSPSRVIGKTLLLKGLEYDHVIIYYNDAWGSDKDMYVALTRACKSISVIRNSN